MCESSEIIADAEKKRQGRNDEARYGDFLEVVGLGGEADVNKRLAAKGEGFLGPQKGDATAKSTWLPPGNPRKTRRERIERRRTGCNGRAAAQTRKKSRANESLD